MTICFSGGAIGISANQRECIELAAKYGFESVEAHGSYLAALTDEQMTELKSFMDSKRIVFGAANLPLEFRRDDNAFATGMKALPSVAAGLKRAGVTRITTWIMPSHDTLTYMANFKLHTGRLREAASLLKNHDVRLGLEYVGPRSLLISKRFPFQHTMAEQKDLIAEIGTGNVGFVLDTYHWWTAGETEDDILSLRNEDVVSVDMNDGVAGVAREEAVDGRRELPCKTGVIDTAKFINALERTGYDGPVRAEPFNKEVNALGKDGACAATIAALEKAFALIR
jgi:sugar phosphate isomerase/epimerase